MAGWYEITQANDGQYRFVLKAGNGEIILNSELYKAKASAVNGIESVQKNSSDDARYDRLTAKNGKPYFNLKAANHQIIGSSQFYDCVVYTTKPAHACRDVESSGPVDDT
ncbi:YegP family protein [Acinetobacter baumannii]|uniref:YegP family protein n=1 Tax=Acinetobacter baumannii TaxID=470 RepID=UPI003510AF23